MYEEFFSRRLAQLRAQKGVSAREMSLAIGQNSSYINRIENQRAFPSMQGFFYICEYLGVTPGAFFADPDAGGAEGVAGDGEVLSLGDGDYYTENQDSSTPTFHYIVDGITVLS